MNFDELKEILSKYTIDFLNKFDNFDNTSGEDVANYIDEWISNQIDGKTK